MIGLRSRGRIVSVNSAACLDANRPSLVRSRVSPSILLRTSSALFTLAVVMTRTHAQKSNYWPGVAAHTHIRSTVGRILASRPSSLTVYLCGSIDLLPGSQRRNGRDMGVGMGRSRRDTTASRESTFAALGSSAWKSSGSGAFPTRRPGKTKEIYQLCSIRE